MAENTSPPCTPAAPPGTLLNGALMLALALTGCVDAGAPDQVTLAGDSSAATIPLDRVGPGGAAVVVPVHINGSGPHDFVLDTGATLTCVDVALADSLGLDAPVGRIGTGMGIGGVQGSMRLVRIDSLRVGNATATDLSGCAVDLAPFREAGVEAHGLVGLNFLSEFRVTLDFQAGQLTLERPSSE